MNKKIKAFISMALSFGILNSSTMVFANENNNDNREQAKITEVDSSRKIVKFSDGKDDYEYDAEDEILKVNNEPVIQFETKVEYLDPNAGITEEEALENEKERIFEELIEPANNSSLMKSARSNFTIPSNAPYTVYAKFSKSIKDAYGELGTGLSHISALTTVLALKKIPYRTLVGAVATVTGLSSYAIENTKGYVGGRWYYTQHRTTQKYRYYNSYQYGYRYAHSGIDLKIRVGGKSYTPYKSYYDVGSWWVNQKPY